MLTGWQPDPYRRYQQRYWDGEKWTEHVINSGLQGTDPVDEQLPKPAAAWTVEDRLAAARSKPKRSARPWLIGIGVAVLVVLFVVAQQDRAADPWSGDGGALARNACADARFALQEMVDGTRSVDSTIGELEDASSTARSAVVLNAKWRPLARAIEGTRAELEAGNPDASTAELVSNCGMPEPP